MRQRVVLSSTLSTFQEGTRPNALVNDASIPTHHAMLNLINSPTRPGGQVDNPLTRLLHMPTGLYYKLL
jgi:hypothetical protein